jgi:polysaccharide pyruvyl transferase WcaK-like protein
VKIDQNKIKHIAIEGAYGEGNFGDDALMLAASRIVMEVYKPCLITYTQGLKPLANAEHELSQEYAHSKKPRFDVIVYGGGTQHFSFRNNQTSTGKFKLVLGQENWKHLFRHIKFRIRQLLESASLNSTTHTIGIGMGIGPFLVNDSSQERAKHTFSKMSFIAVRDQQSLDQLKKWNISKAKQYADLCYTPGLWQVPPKSNKEEKPQSDTKLIGVIIRDWPHTIEGAQHEDPLFRAVEQLRKQGNTVEFISFAPSRDENWLTELKRRNETVIGWNESTNDINSFLTRLSRYHIFITARFHGAIFAAILEKPVVCIEVEQKLRIVAQQYQKGARLWRQPFSENECVSLTNELLNNYTEATQALKLTNEAQTNLAAKMILDLKNHEAQSIRQ